MVKRPRPVIPTIRVVHVCPPIVVRTKLSEFRAVVQELTGVENRRTPSISLKSPTRIEQLHKCARVSEHGSSSPPFIKGSCTPGADPHIRASTYDHRPNNRIATAPSSRIDACNNRNGPLNLDSINTDCHQGACIYENGSLVTHVENVCPYEDLFEGFLSEEDCIDEAVSAISSSLKSPISTSASISYDNCMLSKTGDGDMERIAEMGASGQLLELVTHLNLTSKLMGTRKSGGRPTKKVRLSHATQEPFIDPQHLIGDLVLNSMEYLSSDKGISGCLAPYNDSGSLHADFYYHHLLQRFDDHEEPNGVITPYNDSASLHADFLSSSLAKL